MITVNADEVAVEIKETLSFECNVQPKFDEIRDNVEYAYNEGEIENDNILDDVKAFLNYELTKEDKLAILNNIVEDYEYEQYGNREGYEVSIFDEDFAEKAIIDWVEETFEFRPNEI